MLKQGLLGALFATLMSTAIADTNSNHSERNGFYGGGTLGFMAVDVDNVDPLFNAGLQVGYHFNDGFAVEAQYTDSMSGDSYDVNYGYGSRSIDIDIRTLAAYAVYRSPGSVYFKGRAGVLNEKIGSMSDTGLSAGVGIGFKAGDSAAFEIEATVIEQDVNFISASLNIGF